MNEPAAAQAPVSTWKIKVVAICILVLFGCGTLISAVGPFIRLGDKPVLSIGEAAIAIAINLGFAIGAVGLLKLRRWGLWVTIALCGISILQVIWNLTKLTPETATKNAEVVAYIVAGFYLAIAFFLTSASTRKAFANSGTSQTNVEPVTR